MINFFLLGFNVECLFFRRWDHFLCYHTEHPAYDGRAVLIDNNIIEFRIERVQPVIRLLLDDATNSRDIEAANVSVSNIRAVFDQNLVSAIELRLHTCAGYCNYLISAGDERTLASVPVEVCIDPEKFRPVDLPYLCADNSRIKDFWPGTDIRQTIKEMFESLL